MYCIDGVVIVALMHCDLFEIYCAPPNLGIRTWIFLLNFDQRPIFSGLRLFNEPEISDSGSQLKIPPGGLVLKIFTSWKNPSTSAGFEPASMLPFEAMTGCTAPSSHGLLAEVSRVFLGCKVNARRSVHSPQYHFIITFIISDWRDTRGKWPLARNPDRSWWHRHTNWKFFPVWWPGLKNSPTATKTSRRMWAGRCDWDWKKSHSTENCRYS